MSNLLRDKNTVEFTSSDGKFHFVCHKYVLKRVYLNIFSSFYTEKELEDLRLKYLSEQTVYDLMNPNGSYQLYNYLHNSIGPALINYESGEKQYWMNGKNVTKQKMNSIQFKSDIDSILNED